MQTRNGFCYLRLEPAAALPPAKRLCMGGDAVGPRNRARDSFDVLPDDIVLLILSRLSASAGDPSDIINVILTCRRFSRLATNSSVLSKVSRKGIGLNAKRWSESANRFLKQCAEAGNVEACYTLGMIYFYCLENRRNGLSLMAKAAMASHPEALYSLSVIQFNGSGGSKNHKNLSAGVALCARAACYGHIDALRELGHCLQDGYGVRQNVAEGRRFLVQANARELAGVLGNEKAGYSAFSLLSDFGCSVPAPEGHPANRFMVEWFTEKDGPAAGEGIRMCSHGSCGRPETRRHEFRRCSVCGAVNYCSRACQALHWKITHKIECSPMDRWLDDAAGGDVQPPGEDRGGPVI